MKWNENNTIQYGLAFNYIYNAGLKSLLPSKTARVLNRPTCVSSKISTFPPLPSRLAFRTDFDRRYNEIKMRNIYDDRDILLDSTVSKDFVWNRGYELNWDLTRSLKFDLMINNQSRIDETPVPMTSSAKGITGNGPGRFGTAFSTEDVRSITSIVSTLPIVSR